MKTPAGSRRIETGGAGAGARVKRRSRSVTERQRIMDASLAPGASVAGVAGERRQREPGLQMDSSIAGRPEQSSERRRQARVGGVVAERTAKFDVRSRSSSSPIGRRQSWRRLDQKAHRVSAVNLSAGPSAARWRSGSRTARGCFGQRPACWDFGVRPAPLSSSNHAIVYIPTNQLSVRRRVGERARLKGARGFTTRRQASTPIDLATSIASSQG
jgi:hypothetical protein